MTILYIILINWAVTGIFLANLEIYNENPGENRLKRVLYALKYNISFTFLGIPAVLLSLGAYIVQHWLGRRP